VCQCGNTVLQCVIVVPSCGNLDICKFTVRYLISSVYIPKFMHAANISDVSLRYVVNIGIDGVYFVCQNNNICNILG
jgi:hypothetical protein